METKLERIAEISATTKKPEFTALYHHISYELLKKCHKELDGKKKESFTIKQLSYDAH